MDGPDDDDEGAGVSKPKSPSRDEDVGAAVGADCWKAASEP